MNIPAATNEHAGLISVVMPCFNAGPYVSEAVHSALDQTHGNVELIVVDDGSTDDSPAILVALARRYGDRIRLLRSDRVGPYPARNIALRYVRGEFIAFLDADDWWVPDALAKLHRALQDAEADVAYCGWQNVGEGLALAPHVPPAYEDADPVEAFLRTCPWPIHGALVRRSVVDGVGGFSERRYSSMDYDFWLRVLATTRRIKRVPEVLAFYRWHGSGQVSAVKWRQVLDALYAQQRFIKDHAQLVEHLGKRRLNDLTEGQVLRHAYRAFWKRDLGTAQRLFRHAASNRSFALRDAVHVACALLPESLYRQLIQLAERRRT